MEGWTDADQHSISVAALSISNKTIGFACFDERTDSIYCDSIFCSNDDLESQLLSIKMSCSPTLFILHPKIVANEALLELILSGLSGEPNFYEYKSLKTACWNATEAALQFICDTLIIKSAGKDKRNSTYFWLSAIVDVDCQLLRQSLGALIQYLQANLFNLDGGVVIVSDVKNLPLRSFMRMDDSSFRSESACRLLEIDHLYSEQSFASVLRGSASQCSWWSWKKQRGILTIFIIRSNAISTWAQAIAVRQFNVYRSSLTALIPCPHVYSDWMMKPLCDPVKIVERQNGVGIAVSALSICVPDGPFIISSTGRCCQQGLCVKHHEIVAQS